MSKITVMAHLVAGYPSPDLAFEAARGLAEGGVSYFEIQFPFSDPSADGTAIQTACASVLASGFSLADGFAFVTRLRREFPAIPAYIMTYANLAYKAGIPEFVARAAEAGASGLIIPDLPFDADEGLESACAARGISAVPVAAPSMSAKRLGELVALRRPYVYAALRSGITGASTTIDGATLAFIRSVSGVTAKAGAGSDSRDGAKILGGFGIRSGEQARQLAPEVHAVVAGSVFVDCIRENAAKGAEAVRLAVKGKARELTGA